MTNYALTNSALPASAAALRASCPPASTVRESLVAAPPPTASTIERRVRSGAKWSILALGTRQLVGLITTAVLGRLVLPEAFGLVAMATMLTAFLSLFDVGLGWATVQAREIDRRQINLLFWLGAGIGLTIWGVCLLVGPLLADFYGRSELSGICAVLGAGLMCNSLGAQPAALLKRDLRQQAISVVETLGLLVASAVALSMAASGWGYWALVAQLVALPVVRLAGLLVASGFRPGRSGSLREAAPLVQFGGYYGLCAWVAYFQLYLDSILVGHYGGAEALGWYSRAVFLKTLPTMYAVMTLHDVMTPALAALRDAPDRFAAVYRRALRAVAFVGCPLGAFLGVAAPEVVRLLYGSAWDPVAPLLAWLALTSFSLPLWNTVPWLFIATGKGREFFRLNVIVTPVAVAAFWLAAAGGPLQMARVSGLLFALPIPLFSLWYAHRTAGLALGSTLRDVAPIWIACTAAVLGGLLSGLWTDGWSYAMSLVAKLLVGGGIYGVVCWLLLDSWPLGRRSR